MKIIRVRVRGRVQGVFFRQSTREVAKRAGVIGYARNMADASVEIVATGSDEALTILLDFVGRGPERARVDRLEVAEISLEHLPQGDRLPAAFAWLPEQGSAWPGALSHPPRPGFEPWTRRLLVSDSGGSAFRDCYQIGVAWPVAPHLPAP
ncbi:hypothetical protein Lal_00047996 [Lupinus albus]|nr:hypothetical protein Lal_00047996 [Lupinus albus]